MMAMRVGLIIPEDTPPTGGNAVSAHRVEQGLRAVGVDAEVVLYSPRLPAYDVYHAWNAVRVGARLLEDGVHPDQIVATWTGTDLWQDWVTRATALKPVLDPIRYQVVFTEDARNRLLADAPDWADHVIVISPSVDIHRFIPEGRVAACHHPLAVLAGGVRPVKRSAWGVLLMEQLREETGQDWRLAILGPVRETGEWHRVTELAKTRPWVRLLGEVSQMEMPEWYRAADIFLNTSSVEGVSNALMEAMATGSLAVVSDIQGNRALVEHQKTGLLFSDAAGFVDAVRWADAHPHEVQRIRHEARKFIVGRHSLSHEVARYMHLYQDCLAVRRCRC
ncbi:glycosyl transferase group 1 [Sulfobacillus acidophilus TPY]|nr:glycosyl transferase group 1 [Sulfobacillus acidophilus TPY]